MVSMEEVRALSDAIAREYRPERIILFGSQARGDARPSSDVDLLVLAEYEGSGLSEAAEMACVVTTDFAVDLILRRPEEIGWRYEQGDPLIREALDRGVVLYDRPRAA